MQRLVTFSGRPENQLGSRDRPRFHDDQNPNCGLAGMTSRRVALSVARRRACQLGNSAGACHPMSTRQLVPSRIRSCRRYTHCGRDRGHGRHHGRGPGTHRGVLRSRNHPGSRDPPRYPCHPSPNCSLRCRRIRYADSPVGLGLTRSPNNSAACRRRTNTKWFALRCVE